ncbi:ESX secretion-associated protein EspG [Nocardia coffeae]|uniref:ESX secretion-associated protein EspG n=1 Tax=Nocardia coffeae TaxID=2873381 RepID=UPI001F3CD9C7|nr:ESX secretion-associated protein EspG [Nocardia coffeae]
MGTRMTQWAWEPDDFAALWFSDANDRIPGLLRFTSRFAYNDEFELHRPAVRGRYDADELEQIDLALHTVTTSDMRIEILGSTTKYPGSTGAARTYRIIGARNLHHATVLYQITEGEVDGRIRAHSCRPEQLGARLVATIPAREPGRAQPITVHPRDIRDNHQSATGSTPAERYRRLLARPVDGNGTAALLLGPIHAYPDPVQEIMWCDFDDGRYLQVRGEHISIRPAVAKDLSARFGAWIENAVQRQREEQYERW